MNFPKKFKTQLVGAYGAKCAICSTSYEEDRYLQIDHRIPYEVAAEGANPEGAVGRDPKDYMLLDGSCNRAKSWSCEHCKNWLEDKKVEVCETCYWARPEGYTHVAMRPIRRLDLEWNEKEVAEFDQLRAAAEAKGEPMPDYVKAVLRDALGGDWPGDSVA